MADGKNMYKRGATGVKYLIFSIGKHFTNMQTGEKKTFREKFDIFDKFLVFFWYFSGFA